MADYKRMVSYMYEYEDGAKKKNIGYARIEARNGQCKITLHMQLLGQLDSIVPTYLIRRDERNMDLIYLGDAILKNQIMDSRFLADENNIMDSGFGLSNIGGILLFMHENVFYATEWDDKPIIAQEVIEALKPSSEKEIFHEKGKDTLKTAENDHHNEETLKPVEAEPEEKEPSIVHSIMKDELQEPESKAEESQKEEIKQEEVLIKKIESEEKKEEVNEDLKEEGKVEEIAKVAQTEGSEGSKNVQVMKSRTLEEELRMPKYKLPRGWKTVERLQPIAENADLVKNLSQIKYKTNLINLDAAEVLLKPEEKEIENHQETQVQEKPSQEKQHEKNYAQAQPETNAAEVFTRNDEPEREELNQTREQEGGSEHSTALHFFENYPRIYPFEDNEITYCVKIEPKDIGMLPKETWALSNNSFLLHGYYCYHHLIFAKINDHYGSRYILGIPGIYHNRERFMARMFGFENFKSIRKRELKQGDFGYWHLTVNF